MLHSDPALEPRQAAVELAGRVRDLIARALAPARAG